MSKGVIYDPEHISIIATYGSTAEAGKRLNNALHLGHKIQGRKYRQEWLERMDVTTLEHFHNEIDHDVEVINMMSNKPVIIKASQKGGVNDPSTERHWSM